MVVALLLTSYLMWTGGGEPQSKSSGAPPAGRAAGAAAGAVVGAVGLLRTESPPLPSPIGAAMRSPAQGQGEESTMCAPEDAPGSKPPTGQPVEVGKEPPARAGALNPIPVPSPAREVNSELPSSRAADSEPAKYPSESPGPGPTAAGDHTESEKPPGAQSP